jgi:hypothetical protein
MEMVDHFAAADLPAWHEALAAAGLCVTRFEWESHPTLSFGWPALLTWVTAGHQWSVSRDLQGPALLLMRLHDRRHEYVRIPMFAQSPPPYVYPRAARVILQDLLQATQ